MAMPIEIRMLLWSVVLGVLQLVVATALATKDQGLPYNLSARDLPPPTVSQLSARMLRGSHNFRETFLFFAAAVIALSLLGKASPVSGLGSQLYFWARVLYVPAYAAGIPVLRTLIWTVSVVGIVMVLAAALT